MNMKDFVEVVSLTVVAPAADSAVLLVGPSLLNFIDAKDCVELMPESYGFG